MVCRYIDGKYGRRQDRHSRDDWYGRNSEKGGGSENGMTDRCRKSNMRTTQGQQQWEWWEQREKQDHRNRRTTGGTAPAAGAVRSKQQEHRSSDKSQGQQDEQEP